MFIDIHDEGEWGNERVSVIDQVFVRMCVPWTYIILIYHKQYSIIYNSSLE